MSEEVILERITIRNFMSFGNNSTTIELSQSPSTLVLGENLDAVSNNGAGKTTIFNAICYALYNKPFDTISLQRLINTRNNIKNTQMEVSLELSKGGNHYEIRRSRGETFNIQILENGEDITLDSVSENDKKIEMMIGMSYDMFTRIVVLSGNTPPFLMLPVSAQRLLLDELIGITQLADRANDLRKEIKNTETSIAVEDALVKANLKAKEVYNKQCEQAEDRLLTWENNREDQIKRLRELHSTHAGTDFELELETHDIIATSQQALSGHQANLANLSRSYNTAQTAINKLTKELAHLADDKCPYCLQEFADAQQKISSLQEELETHTNVSTDLSEQINSLKDVISELTAEIATVQATLKFKTKQDALSVQAKLARLDEQINDLESSVNPHIDAYDALIAHAESASVDYTKMDELKSTLDHQKVLLKLLVDKNSFIRKRLIGKSIPFINTRLIHHSREMGLPHVVKFNADMECTVSEHGRELDWGNLSSGEKKRVSISLALTFRDAWHHLHFKINGLFVDEIEQSLDVGGINDVYKILKNKSRDDGVTLWIISHHPEAQGRFDRTVVVRKEAGFSNFIEDPGM